VSDFPHLTGAGEVHMVDVGGKPETERSATAEAVVAMSGEVAGRLFAGALPKGDALASVRLAGIMGAKRTPDLVPLCHPITLTGVTVEVEPHPVGARITATTSTVGRTGVEMEAMTAVAAASLALYDMVKGLDRSVAVESLRLLEKRGGRSGTWLRPGA
jgi:cyclic pyranopterin monophosphate synthase